MDNDKTNAGNWNAGDWNAGNWNAGDRNAGDRNAGNWNAGDWNAGDRNAGHWNAGDRNAGYRNAGNGNAGDGNAGYRNAGDWNAGDWNAGDWNAGFFCTENRSPMFFDKPTALTRDEAIALIPSVELPVNVEWIESKSMTDDERSRFAKHATTGGFLRVNVRPICETFPLAWAKMSDAERLRWTTLPNFDAEKFLKITGVDVRVPDKRVRVRLDDGSEVLGTLIKDEK